MKTLKTLTIIFRAKLSFGLILLTSSFLTIGSNCSKESTTAMIPDTQDEQTDPADDIDPEEPNGASFTTVTRITPGGVTEGDFFGFSMAANDEITAVSAPFNSEKGQRTGMVYTFKRNGSLFENRAETLYIDMPTTEDNFGWSLALYENTLVVGAPKNDKYGEDAGVAFIFEHQGNNQWIQTKEIKAPNARAGQLFGDAVAIYGGTIAIAAQFDEDNYYDQGEITNGAGIAQGSVYLYDLQNNWEFMQKLTPEDDQGHKWDAFGTSLAMKATTLAIGAKGTDNTTYKQPGSVYIFKNDGALWQQQDRITAEDGKSEDFFGTAVALDDDALAITAPGSFNSLVPDLSAVEYGAVYVFKNSGDNWEQDVKLLAAQATPEDGFGGGGVALQKDYLIAGASLTEVATRYNGVAYLFERDGWQESHRIVAPDPLNEDFFGSSIAATDDMIFIGAHRRCNDTGCWAGALYFTN